MANSPFLMMVLIFLVVSSVRPQHFLKRPPPPSLSVACTVMFSQEKVIRSSSSVTEAERPDLWRMAILVSRETSSSIFLC